MEKGTQFQTYIKLSSPEKISKKDIRRWFEVVSTSGPKGIIGSVQMKDEKLGTKESRLVAKKYEKGFGYFIPLNRDLLASEVETIVSEWADGFNDEYEIEVSSESLEKEKISGESVLISDYKLEGFAEKVAKRMHTKWYNKKVSEGWRYGPKFDQRKKVNPMLKSWDELPDDYKQIDPEMPQMFMDLLREEGYVVLSEGEFDNLVSKVYIKDIE